MIREIVHSFVRRYMKTRSSSLPIPRGGASQAEQIARLHAICGMLNFTPKAIVDIGASDGRWFLPASRVFADARFFLVEPLDQHAETLKALAMSNNRMTYCRALLGSEVTTKAFMIHGHQSSTYCNTRGETFGKVEERKTSLLDQVLEENNFPPPDLIKVDVEGGEIDVLKGGLKALQQAEIVEMEINFLPYRQNLPLFDDVVIFMSQQGFRVLDVFSVYGRPLDGLPAQGECLFIKKDSHLIKDVTWSRGLPWS